MKKIFVMLSMAAVALASCSKEDAAAPEGGNDYVKVTFSAGKSDVTRTVVTDSEITWEKGDKVGLYLVPEGNGDIVICEFTAVQSGVWSDFTGEVPKGKYIAAAAYYPYNDNDNVSLDKINRRFVIKSIDDEMDDDCGTYDFCYDYMWDTEIEIADSENSDVLPDMVFKSLLGFVHIKLNADGPISRFVLKAAEGYEFPRGGVVNLSEENEGFEASAGDKKTDEITINTDKNDFIIGLLPQEEFGDVTAKVVTADGFSAETVITPVGMESNTMYTLEISREQLAKKSYDLKISSAIDTKYGTGTYGKNGLFQISSADDPNGYFYDWYFWQAELKYGPSENDGGDVLTDKDRILLMVPATALSPEKDRGAFCTSAVNCADGVKTATVKFTVGSNNMDAVHGVDYIIGAIDDNPSINDSYLRNTSNYVDFETDNCNRYDTGESRTYQFEIKDGQRIAVAVTNNGRGGRRSH